MSECLHLTSLTSESSSLPPYLRPSVLPSLPPPPTSLSSAPPSLPRRCASWTLTCKGRSRSRPRPTSPPSSSSLPPPPSRSSRRGSGEGEGGERGGSGEGEGGESLRGSEAKQAGRSSSPGMCSPSEEQRQRRHFKVFYGVFSSLNDSLSRRSIHGRATHTSPYCCSPLRVRETEEAFRGNLSPPPPLSLPMSRFIPLLFPYP